VRAARWIALAAEVWDHRGMPETAAHLQNLETALNTAVDKTREVLDMETTNLNAGVAQQYATVAKTLAEAIDAARR
jgi:hypothetical protein